MFRIHFLLISWSIHQESHFSSRFPYRAFWYFRIKNSESPWHPSGYLNATYYSALHVNQEWCVDGVSSDHFHQCVGIWKAPPWLVSSWPSPRRRTCTAQCGRWLFLPTGSPGFSISGILMWRAYCAGCRDEAFGILLNPPDFPVVISNCCHWAHRRWILRICSIEMYGLWTSVILLPEKKDGARR